LSSLARTLFHAVAIQILCLIPAAGWAEASAPGPEPDGTWIRGAQDHIALREYRASENGEGLQAPNRRHGLRTYFEPTGIRVVDRVAGGSPDLLALRLQRMGRPQSLSPVGPGAISHDGPRVEIQRDALLEWYRNDPSGLEQGFTLEERPRGEGLLLFELSLEGARASESSDSLRIVTSNGRELVYGQLMAVDADGTSLQVALSAPAEDRIRLAVDDTDATYPIVVDPLLTAAAANSQLEGGQTTAHLGFSVSGAGDVNNDGYSDIILGAWRYDAGQVDEGAAFVFLGSAAGIADASAAAAHAQLESDQTNARMGEYVGGAGDINGDGYDDVIVGAFWYDAPEVDEGAAFIFLGSASGVADGNPTTAHARLEADQAGAEMGVNVAGAGDVNGDGYDDVIVGAWHYDAGQTDEGVALVYLGSASGIANGTPATAHAQIESDQANAQLGISVDGAGDVDDDGYDDVIVGAHFYNGGLVEEGAAFVFLGSAGGIVGTTPATAHAQLESDQAGAWMGVNVGGAGDVNNDGYSDVIVGARLYDAGQTDEGAAFVFHGSASGIADGTPASADAQLEGDQANAWMGYSVDGAGDVDGDGYGDVVVGAGRYDGGQTDEGAAFIFKGSASGIANASPATAHFCVEADQATAFMGASVSGAGDVNGDGFSDVVLGAYRYDAGQTDEGAAFVFLPEPGGSLMLVAGCAALGALERRRVRRR